MRTVEIRTFRLKAGTGSTFRQTYQAKCVPLLEKWKFDLVAYRFSLDDPDSFLVIRAFDSLEHRQISEDEFYAHDEWRKGPREEVLSMIEEYHDVVLTLADEVVEGIRGTNDPNDVYPS